MSVYKDGKQGTWYASFRYTDWMGQRKQKMKRGFRTKKEAVKFEMEFIASVSGDMDMTFASFIEVYFQDKSGELKQNSVRNKRDMMNAHILPYFGEKKMNEVTPADIIAWQNEIRTKGYKPTYERMIQNQLTALYTHAVKIYNLANNPCKKVKKMGKPDAEKLDFWTQEEYETFIRTVEEGSDDYIMFEILFWTGIREGELLALNKSDFDFRNNLLHITKTYNRIDKQDVITVPKTENSVRTINIPNFLKEKVQRYIDMNYGIPDDARLFPIVSRTLQKRMKRYAEKAGVKEIRVHDLRHSHAAYLIFQGIQPLMVKERLGHKDIKITLNTYGHLYPTEQKALADMLDEKRKMPRSEDLSKFPDNQKF